MTFRAALTNLVLLQKSLRISEPRPLQMKNAYPYPPSSNVALDMPSVMNTWTLVGIARHTTGGVLRHSYIVHSQVFCYDADQDQAADVATAFLQAYIDALYTDTTLHGTVKQVDLRGGNPTLVSLEWAGKSYRGLQLDLDLFFDEAVTYA